MDLPQSRIRWKARRNLMDMAVYKMGLMALKITKQKCITMFV